VQLLAARPHDSPLSTLLSRVYGYNYSTSYKYIIFLSVIVLCSQLNSVTEIVISLYHIVLSVDTDYSRRGRHVEHVHSTVPYLRPYGMQDPIATAYSYTTRVHAHGTVDMQCMRAS
jgi:hypothetical protein